MELRLFYFHLVSCHCLNYCRRGGELDSLEMELLMCWIFIKACPALVILFSFEQSISLMVIMSTWNNGVKTIQLTQNKYEHEREGD
jgi:hypothetical protein